MTKTITTVPVAVPGFPKALIKFFENFHGNALRCEGMNCSLYTMVDWGIEANRMGTKAQAVRWS